MVRLVGVDLPRNKRIAYALTYIHGIGIKTAKNLIESANISKETRTFELSIEQTILLRKLLENLDLKLEGDLRRFNGLNIKRLNELLVLHPVKERINTSIYRMDVRIDYKKLLDNFINLKSLL